MNHTGNNSAGNRDRFQSAPKHKPLSLKKRLKRTASLFLIVTSGLMIPLMYQNCVMPRDSAFEKRYLTSEEKINNAPFPYEIQMDTISYMSCSSVPAEANPDMFYTFRLGAFNFGSGIRLHEDFRDYALEQELSEEERLELVAKSPKTVTYEESDEEEEEDTIQKSIQMQFSIRDNDYVRTTPAINQHYISIEDQMHNLWQQIYFNNGEIARTINSLPKGEFLNNYEGAIDDNQLMGSLFLGTLTHTQLQSIFTEQSGSGQSVIPMGGASLIMGYLSAKDWETPYANSVRLAAPSETEEDYPNPYQVYGAAYVPTFNYPRTFDYNRNELGETGYLHKDNRRVISDIFEYNPQNGRLVQDHACDEDSVQLMIVFDETAYEDADCGGFGGNPINQNKYDLADHVVNYYGNYWEISDNVNCIRASGLAGGGVSAGKHCYGDVPDSRIDDIQWIIGNDPEDHKCGGGGEDVKYCPHFVTICDLQIRP